MKKPMTVRALGAMAFVALSVASVEAELPLPPIAKEAGCLACHGIDTKILGPSFTWIAHKYKDDQARGKKAIVNKIANGAAGEWNQYTGGIAMPPATSLTSEAQRNELADYILSLEPTAPSQ